jgi:hypothetical protein
MIYIDYQGGAHGNFLEFVCNKYLAGVLCNDSPFNELGAAHAKTYHTDKKFNRGHYSDFRGVKTQLQDSKIISVQITTDDLLPLQSISLLRTGNHNIDPDQLEVGTYHKLNNTDYRWMLDNIIHSFFETQIQDSYNAVRDPSWPQISCMDDFLHLPDWIQQECFNIHALRLLQLDQDRPDCPRYVLREFFKIGFRDPQQAGFIQQQEKMVYDVSNNVLVFPFSCFYDTEQFMSQILRIAQWSQYSLQNEKDLLQLHNEFLKRQPYKHSKSFCDAIIDQILRGEFFDLPKLDLMQESYICGQLEKHFGRELPADQVKWFENSCEILDLLVK